MSGILGVPLWHPLSPFDQMHVYDTIKLHPLKVFKYISSNFEIFRGVSMDLFWDSLLLYMNPTRYVDARIVSLRESLVRELITF